MYKIIFIFLFTFFIMTEVKAETFREAKIKEKIEFDENEKCSPESVSVSNNSQKVAIGCRNRITGKYYWKINNQKLMRHDDLGSLFYFAPDNQNYTYVAIEKGERILVINEKKYIFDGKLTSVIKISPDSTKIISLVQNDNGKFKLILNGKEEKLEWYYLENVQISPDSKKYLYVAADNEFAYLIENDKIILQEKLRLTFNSKEKKKQMANFINVIYSPDSSKIAYRSYNPETGMCQYINGKQVSEFYEEVEPMVFSPNSKHFAFIARNYKTKKTLFIKNNIKSEEFDGEDVFFDLNNKGELVFIALQNDQWFFIKNNEKKIILKNLTSGNFGNVIYSPDGRSYVYYVEGRKEKQESYFVINGKETNKFENISKVLFSKDSKYFFYIGIKRRPDRKYQSEIFINTELNGNGKYEYFKIYDLYYDVNQNKLFYPVILINDPNSIYLIEENIIEK